MTPESQSPPPIQAADLVSALSYALDLTEGHQTVGKSVRTCLLGMRIARHLRLSPAELTDLYYSALLKDAGCSSNAERVRQIFGGDDLAAKRNLRRANWRTTSPRDLFRLLPHVAPGESWRQRFARVAHIGLRRKENAFAVVGLRCERGASIVGKMGFSDSIAHTIYHLDEHWDGQGIPDGLRGDQIPLLSQIIALAQTVEAFAIDGSHREALEITRRRRKTWFSPELAKVLPHLENDTELWQHFRHPKVRARVLEMDPGGEVLMKSGHLDELCDAFSEVIDAKTHFTWEHSRGVARATLAIARRLELDEATVVMLRRAALLHDIGKLGVSNAILEKPGKLTADEWEQVRLHPQYTQEILERVGGFEHLAFIASAHHERLDGRGYYRNLAAEQLTLPARILAVADVFDALHADRPYRQGMPREKVFAILRRESPHSLDGDCVQALKEALESGGLPETPQPAAEES